MKKLLIAALAVLTFGSVANAGGFRCTQSWNTINCRDNVMRAQINRYSDPALGNALDSLGQMIIQQSMNSYQQRQMEEQYEQQDAEEYQWQLNADPWVQQLRREARQQKRVVKRRDAGANSSASYQADQCGARKFMPGC